LDLNDIVRDRQKYVRGWTGGLPETECGSGSRLKNTRAQREWIPQIIKKYGIRSIADIGAGDLNWIKTMDMSGIEYTAYDLVPRVESVIGFDLVQEVPPKVDMIMCLWVLNHMMIDESRAAIANLKASGSKYLLMTDRPIWHCDQPEEIIMPHIESLRLTHKGDQLLLIEL
jgi:hypothetical protein